MCVYVFTFQAFHYAFWTEKVVDAMSDKDLREQRLCCPRFKCRLPMYAVQPGAPY